MPGWLKVVLGVIASIAALGGIVALAVATDDRSNGDDHVEEEDPAAVDASMARCGIAGDEVTATGSVTNHSAKVSDYALAVVVTQGSKEAYRLVTYVRGLPPGERRGWELSGRRRYEADAACTFEPWRSASQTTNGWCAHFGADPTARKSAEEFEPTGVDTIALCKID